MKSVVIKTHHLRAIAVIVLFASWLAATLSANWLIGTINPQTAQSGSSGDTNTTFTNGIEHPLANKGTIRGIAVASDAELETLRQAQKKMVGVKGTIHVRTNEPVRRVRSTPVVTASAQTVKAFR